MGERKEQCEDGGDLPRAESAVSLPQKRQNNAARSRRGDGIKGTMRVALLVLGIFAMLMLPAQAQQHRSGPEGPSPKEKAAQAAKAADRKATDDAYQAAIKRTPDSTQKVDPWATVRAPAQK